MTRIREHVHIHASADRVYGQLSAFHRHGEWLPPAFHHFTANGREVSFELALPLRRERARLSVTAEQAPLLLALERGDGAANDAGSLESLTWALHAEAAGEVHLTVEAVYQPAGGAPGALLEPLLYGPLRRQAFRDALWRLKLLIEGRAAPRTRERQR